MKTKVKRLDIIEAELPFRNVFKHALKTRLTSGSIFVKLYLENGLVGYGEALPREYVTGESVRSVSLKLRRVLPDKLLGIDFSSWEEGLEFLEQLKELDAAARCCVEIALLDALGKCFRRSISAVIGGPINKQIFYSGVISADSASSVRKRALQFKAFEFKSVKLKVGASNDLDNLKIVRETLGDKIDLRVDANCAWDEKEAVEKISLMRKFRISAVEQPVKPHNIRGLKKITDSVSEMIIADESLSTIKDARELIKHKACDMFNIRLSKCGGILNALKIAGLARKNSIRYQLGCQAGESGILSAAGRHFACGLKDIVYCEGSYGEFLLKKDITKEKMSFGQRGAAGAISGHGLGINVADKVLNKYAVSYFIIE